MSIMDKVVDVMRDMKEAVWKRRVVIGSLIAVIMFGFLIGGYGLFKLGHMNDKPGASGFLDYMPDVPRTCPSDYRCGGVSREQVRMERRLYADLREGSKYALPETVTMDAYDVVPSEAEPTSCLIRRAARARETPMPEGQYTPWDEIEAGFLNRKEKKPMESQPIKTLG